MFVPFSRHHEDLLAGTPGEPAAAQSGFAAGQRGRARAGMGADRGRGTGHRRAHRGHKLQAVGRGLAPNVFAGHVPGGRPALRIAVAGQGLQPR